MPLMPLCHSHRVNNHTFAVNFEGVRWNSLERDWVTASFPRSGMTHSLSLFSHCMIEQTNEFVGYR